MSASLRDAKFLDHWRTLYKKRFPLTISEISINNANIFHNLNFKLNGNLNVIIGKNGVGKTNFLRNIFNALNCDGETNRSDFIKLLDNNDIYFKYIVNNSEKTYQFLHQDKNSRHENKDLLSFIFDPCYLIPELQSLLNNQQNFDEILEGFNPVIYLPNQIDEINYLSNNIYTKVSVFNIEDEYPNFPILPIFEVERDGLKYDSRAMGLGELSMLYSFWMLDYVSNLNKNILIIIEEPESFISPLVQNRFVNILVKYIVEKSLNCIMSTHSDHILNKVHANSLKKLIYYPRKNEYKFIELKNLEILSTLGLSIPKKGILFFEDKAAEIFLKQLIKKSSLNAVENFYYHCSGDDSHVVQHINEMPKTINNFKFVGVFDGDARNKVPVLLKDNPKHIFLPTNVSPEEVIISYLNSCDLDSIDSFLHLQPGEFEGAFQTATGADHHELFKNIAKMLSSDFESLFTQLCDFWIRDETSSSEVQIFINKFDSIFK